MRMHYLSEIFLGFGHTGVIFSCEGILKKRENVLRDKRRTLWVISILKTKWMLCRHNERKKAYDFSWRRDGSQIVAMFLKNIANRVPYEVNRLK